MIKINKTHNTIRLIIVFTLISTFMSCAKWDEFKDYIEEGEIVYVGKLDSVKVLSGDERIKVVAEVKPDPKIRKALIMWNDGKDSLTLDIEHNSLIEQYIPMPEGIVSFQLFTIDDKGNRSIAVPAIGRAYGLRYKAGLSNRLISNAIIDSDNKAIIDWQEMDMSAGPIGTEVRYMSNTGVTKTIFIPINELNNVIPDFSATTTTVDYRTLFMPQKTSIDTFYTEFNEANLDKDITSQYLKNYRNPIATSVVSGRWGIPADWITNAAVRNFRDGSNYFGGVDHWFGGPFLAMEAGWSGDNLGNINNGKIYQTFSLPAGHYIFELHIPDCSVGGDFYTVVAEGAEIPNIENVTSAIGYLKTNSPGDHILKFSLSDEKQVSLGFVGNLANKGAGDGTFWRINVVSLKQIVNAQ